MSASRPNSTQRFTATLETDERGFSTGPSVREVGTVCLMGARYADVSESDAVGIFVDAAVAGRGYWTITANLDHLRRYTRDPQARELMDSADMVVADGTPLIWASRLAGIPLSERVAGSNMIWSICEAASRRDASVFLLGGDPGVAERAVRVLADRYPALSVVGTSCPPLGFERDDDEVDRIERHLLDAAPQVVFVGLGFPKQDLLIRRLRCALPGVSFIGVGISFSFVAGDVTRAPEWTHAIGLEWAHRLLKEPRRLIRRYLVQGVPFVLRLFMAAAWHRVAGGEERWGSNGVPPDSPDSGEPF
jgi:N-acetylglucosaminyldiphosphoundecaprenol N-acetyl-beta-D-mannosaminyltransferase